MRSWLAVAIFLALAGCSSPSPDPAPTETGPSVITAPDQGLNDTAAHIHDYWRGGDRLTIVDAMHPGGDEPGTGPGFANGESIEVRSFQPESQAVVPQGTAFLEVTFTWTDADLDSYRDPVLWLKTAAQDATTAAGPVVSGEILNVSVTADDADLPHQLLSAWIFELRMSSPEPMPLRFKGAVELKVEALRGRELPVFPAHPDAWKGATELPLIEAAWSLSYFEDLGDGGCNGAQCPQIHRPPVGQLVPHNASAVRVTFESNGVGPAGSNLRFLYHSGLAREFQGADGDIRPGVVTTLEIPVDGGGDGPYAKQSQWEFTVIPSSTGPLTTAWNAEYSFSAVVIR